VSRAQVLNGHKHVVAHAGNVNANPRNTVAENGLIHNLALVYAVEIDSGIDR
jgi:hypothetical protein